MAPHLRPSATVAARDLKRPRGPLLIRALSLSAGAMMGLGAGAGYLAAVPAGFVGTAVLVAEPGSAAPDRVAALLTRTILSDGVLARAARADGINPAPLVGQVTAASAGPSVEIAAPGRSRESAARLANAVAEAALLEQAERAAASGAGVGGGPSPAEARAALDEAERRLRALRGTGPASPGDRALDEAEGGLALARARLAELAARAEALGQGREPDLLAEASLTPALDRLRQGWADAARAETALKTTLGPLHPAVKEAETQARSARRLYQDELKRAGRQAAAERDAAAARVQALEAQVAGQRGSAVAGAERLVAAEAEVEARRAALGQAEAAAEGALDRAALAAPVRVLRAATPESAQARPDPAPILGGGLLGGALGGLLLGLIGSASLARRRGERARPVTDAAASPPQPEAAPPLLLAFHPAAPAEAEPPAARPPSRLSALVASAPERWSLPRLAACPDGAARALADDPGSAYGEVVRALRRHLNARVPPGGALTVLVASEEPGLGRSALAANLAQSFADVARRVVLVDAASRPGEAASSDPRAAGAAPTFLTVRHGGAMPYQCLAMSSLGAASAHAQGGRIAWSLIRLARSAFDVAVVDAPALAASRLAASGAGAADAAIVLCPADDPAAFATLAILDPADLAEAEGAPALRGTLVA